MTYIISKSNKCLNFFLKKFVMKIKFTGKKYKTPEKARRRVFTT